MAMFLVIRRRSGPEYQAARRVEDQSGWDEHATFMDALVDEGFVILGGPLEDEHHVALVVEAATKDAVEERLGADPWTGSHLVTKSIEAWTIRLDGRQRH